jgi:serine/threonine protein kinase
MQDNFDNIPKEIVDEHGNIHKIANELSRGGFGAVYKTEDRNIALKLIFDRKNHNDYLRSSCEIEKFKETFGFLKTLPVDNSCGISMPIALTEGIAGFSMELFNDMTNISELIPIATDGTYILDIFSSYKEEVFPTPLKRWISSYISTGGLRRRLFVLANTAASFAKLHGNGLYYGDISANNVFVSRNNEFSHCRLIDADNIEYDVLSKTGSGTYTAGYASPELMQEFNLRIGRKPNDVHAYAVVAFKVLTGMHPFTSGEVVLNPDDFDDKCEQYALNGKLPWVYDENDKSNATKNIINSIIEKIIPSELLKLFDMTFTRGRKSPGFRPTIYHWYNVLCNLADNTILCPHCGMTYYSDPQGCYICDEPRPQIVTAKSKLRKFEHEISDAVYLPKRLFDINKVGDITSNALGITKSRDKFKLSGLLNEEIIVLENGCIKGQSYNFTFSKEEIVRYQYKFNSLAQTISIEVR